MFNKITNQDGILTHLRKCMQDNEIVPGILSREHRKGGIIYEGLFVNSLITLCQENEVVVNLSITKTGATIAQLKLSKIEYILLLRQQP